MPLQVHSAAAADIQATLDAAQAQAHHAAQAARMQGDTDGGKDVGTRLWEGAGEAGVHGARIPRMVALSPASAVFSGARWEL